MATVFGTPDWQKISVWDGPLLVNEVDPALVGPYISPILNVSRFARLAGHAGTGTQLAQFFAQWYQDPAAAVVVGSRAIILHTNVVERLHLQLPNLGPFLRLTLSPDVPANPFAPVLQVFGSNRQQPIELVPQNAQLVDYGATAIAAAGNKINFFNGYFSGPASLYVDAGAACTVELYMYLTEHGVARPFYREDFAAAARPYRTIIIPPTACYLQVTNTSAGAANFQAKIVPSFTGG